MKLKEGTEQAGVASTGGGEACPRPTTTLGTLTRAVAHGAGGRGVAQPPGPRQAHTSTASDIVHGSQDDPCGHCEPHAQVETAKTGVYAQLSHFSSKSQLYPHKRNLTLDSDARHQSSAGTRIGFYPRDILQEGARAGASTGAGCHGM